MPKTIPIKFENVLLPVNINIVTIESLTKLNLDIFDNNNNNESVNFINQLVKTNADIRILLQEL